MAGGPEIPGAHACQGTEMKTEVKQKSLGQSIVRLILCGLIIAGGMAGFIGLKKMKKAPLQTPSVEKPIRVKAMRMIARDAPVVIESSGELRPQRMVDIAAEVAGRVVVRHADLAVGRIIEEGEILFAIDDRDFRVDYEMSLARLEALERETELARREFNRLKKLLREENVGTEAAVETAEKATVLAAERLAQVRQAARRAENNLDRSVVRAPFDGRVVHEQIEIGEYVTPGKVLLGLADDSVLELVAVVDSEDARRWLAFAPQGTDGDRQRQWFAPLQRLPATVRWSEDGSVAAKGIVERVQRYDTTTRSLEVLIRLAGETDNTKEPGFPLVAGMYCQVEIPAATMTGVFVLPRWAVSFNDTVYVVEDQRLTITPVVVADVQGDRAFIAEGLNEGDLVITTRLVDPLEQSLVEVVEVVDVDGGEGR